MKKTILSGIIGLIAGVLLTFFVIYQMAPGMMILEDESKYGFEETVEKLKESVIANNWKIPKIHDLQKSMAKSGKDIRPVQVIELCHPDHAGRLLKESEERIVSSLMPCRVAVYEKADGKTYISRMNSGQMAGMLGGLIAEVMDVASRENEEILEAVISVK